MTFDFSQLERLEGWAQWLPDGRPVACGNEKGRQSRCYVRDARGGLQPITPEGMACLRVSPDGKSLAIGPTRRTVSRILPLGGANSQPIRGVTSNDLVVAWTRDSRSLIVQTRDVPARLERLDPATGTRVLIRTVAPADRTGLLGIVVTSVREDGRYYAYNYSRNRATLYVVTTGRETAAGTR